MIQEEKDLQEAIQKAKESGKRLKGVKKELKQ